MDNQPALADDLIADEIEERHWALLDLRLSELKKYNDLRGSSESVEAFVGCERIPEVYAERVAITWIRKGRILTHNLLDWLEKTVRDEDLTLAEIVDRARRRPSTHRAETLRDLEKFLEYVADAYPLEEALRVTVAKVHARHAAARAGAARREAAPRQLTLTLQR